MSMGSTLHGIASRAKASGPGRMLRYARASHERTGIPTAILFADIGLCKARRDIGPMEYYGYGFAGKPSKLRDTYMTTKMNLTLVREFNDYEKRKRFEDKVAFLEDFSVFSGRDWIDLRTSPDSEKLHSFLRSHEFVFVKPTDDFGGHGIERIETAKIADATELYRRLVVEGKMLLEEAIEPHPEMCRISPNAVSTLRICTFRRDGKPHHMYTVLRVGVGDAAVDNATSGGLFGPVDDDGILRCPLYSGTEGTPYLAHPTTGVVFDGFEIPMMKQAVELCLEASGVVPEVAYVGWDIAITPTGPVLVEGNPIPGFDMPQWRNQSPEDVGMLPKFEQVLGRKIML